MSEEQAPTDGRGGTHGGDGTAADEAVTLADDYSMTATELDALFECLASRQRRLVLTHLVETDDGIATFSNLIRHVLGEGTRDEDRERLAVRLHHVHLPKLDDHGFVEYDARSETVRYRGGPAVTEWIRSIRQ
ncbi:DUF7344 domain-containing protein [Halorussus amylolyticus]|uniref:DUF7344 domain-containing protein n=1 Tax=Halorussus amylolyticus TaxID=1126242 RepID=UPI001049CE12|nr:hypothetical protein [Halorussus amylolyticus]